MLSLTVLLLVAVTGVLSASQVPRCTTDVINKVKAHWKVSGTPHHVTGFPESFKIVGGSTSAIAKTGQCKTFKFTPGFLYDESDKKSLKCTENQGVLSLADSDSYVISFDQAKGCFTTLRCSNDGPWPSANNPPLVSVAASDKAKAEDVQKAYQTLSQLGFTATNYQCK